jgi:uncharacterized membrane protein
MKHARLQKLTMAALFSALVYVATNIIHIPVPSTNGYLNLGDGVILLGAFLLGPWYGAAAAGLGSMLADLLLGYAAYAPGTFVIKALVAVLAASLFRTFREKAGVTASVLIAGAAAECWMIAGYFGYESFILGYGPAAAAGMAGNAVQGAAGLALGAVLYQSLYHIPSVRKAVCVF